MMKSIIKPDKAQSIVNWRQLGTKFADPAVIVAFIAGVSSVTAAWVAQHSFIDKSICRIKSDDMVELSKIYADSLEAKVQWMLRSSEQQDDIRSTYRKGFDQILIAAESARDRLRAGHVITENDLKNFAKGEVDDDQGVEKKQAVEDASKHAIETDEKYSTALRGLLATCP